MIKKQKFLKHTFNIFIGAQHLNKKIKFLNINNKYIQKFINKNHICFISNN
jgi:hypothetical protein